MSKFFKAKVKRGGWWEITEHDTASPNVGEVVARVFGEARARYVAERLHVRAEAQLRTQLLDRLPTAATPITKPRSPA